MMNTLKKLNQTSTSNYTQWGYAIVRICFGLLVATHGWAKIEHFGEYAAEFSDPFGLGSKTSLILTIAAEFVCALLVALGLFTRLAAVPLIICFATIFFVVHGADPLGDKELPAMYLGLSVGTLLMGSGKISVDRLLGY